MRFRILLISFLLWSLLLGGCAVNSEDALSSEEQFIKDIPSIAATIQAMHDEIDADFLHEVYLYIAFCDLDFDGIPEFFYGYQAITSYQAKIWYRVYSLADHAMISSEHLDSGWNTYIQGDTDCTFFTGPDNFIEGYYLDDLGNACFVTKTYAGPVTNIRTDYTFIEYTDSKLLVRTGFSCDEELHPLMQVWGKTGIGTLESDIEALLNEYLSIHHGVA